MIYCIQAIGVEAVKFGRANDPVERLANHQIGCPLELRILAIADWPDDDEVRIHRYLAEHHLRGEWFTITGRVYSVIEMMNTPSTSKFDPPIDAAPIRLQRLLKSIR